MSGQSSFEETPRLRSLLDQLLKGKSATYKAKVRDLVLKNGWDVNDPSFAILIATGKLEVLLDLFPEQFEVLFERLLEGSKQQFLDFQGWMEGQKSDVRGYVQGMEAAGDKTVSRVAEQVDGLRGAALQQRADLRGETQALVELVRQERSLIQGKALELGEAAAKAYLAMVYKQAETLIAEAGTRLRSRYLRELLWPVLGTVAVLLSVGGVLGWGFHRLAMGELDPAGPRQLSLKQWKSLQWAVSQEGLLARQLVQQNGNALNNCVLKKNQR